MGLIKATIGSVGGTLADQWKDFFAVPRDIGPTAAIFPAIRYGQNAGRGSNTKASQAIITNGSKIIVPEGYGLLLFEDGEITAFASEPGGYIWSSDDPNSQSIFAGDNWSTSLVRQSWERLKFGGRPGSQQLALFVALKELPNNRFGTQSEIYWDDAYLNAQVGVTTHGTYTVNIIDPILFATQFVPATYLQTPYVFDFTDPENPAATQLFTEVVGSLAAAFSSYTNDSQRNHRITSIQQDSIGFAESLSKAVDDAYKWREARGLDLSNVTIIGIEYEESTRLLLEKVQRADALAGTRGNANLQASVAAGMEAAGEAGGSEGIIGLGIAGGSIGLESLNQPQPSQQGPQETPNPPDSGQSLVAKLEELKAALDAGLISQEDFDAAKANALGIE
jgi:membrane protease subunit (stomatin/prohibitin family)